MELLESLFLLAQLYTEVGEWVGGWERGLRSTDFFFLFEKLSLLHGELKICSKFD